MILRCRGAERDENDRASTSNALQELSTGRGRPPFRSVVIVELRPRLTGGFSRRCPSGLAGARLLRGLRRQMDGVRARLAVPWLAVDAT